MLKAIVFAVTVGLAALAAADAAETDLLVGNLRDAAGIPIAGADVRAFDARGASAGGDRTASDGTFAIPLTASAARLMVRCRYCRPTSIDVRGTSNVAVVVQRFAALESDVPSAADLSALPYGRIVDDLSLMPFAVPRDNDTDISDRGLGGGRGLVIDSGVPLVDFATGGSALVDYPDRYVQSISITGPEDAFRYGSYAGGGVFALDPNPGPDSYGAADTGGAPALALEPSIVGLRPAYGESNDDGTFARRADLAATEPFAGGMLDANVASAGETILQTDPLYDLSRSDDLFHIGYATASRRYRTFADVSAADVSIFDNVAQENEYRSSYLSADVRLEHPAAITVAVGALTTRQTATAYDGASLAGRSYDETAYAEARTGTQFDGAYAGLGLTDESVLESLHAGRTSGDRLALVPSFGGSLPLGDGGLYLRAGYSESLRTPTLLESNAQPSPGPLENSAPQERDELAQGAVGFDSGARVRAEAIAYREDRHGFDEESQLGVGASLVWQIAPLLSLRASTVRASPQEYAEIYGPYAAPDTSRQVAWATYANGSGLRFDAVAHRDINFPTRGVVVDGDAYIPVTHAAALDVGTAHTTGPRTFYLGLRTR